MLKQVADTAYRDTLPGTCISCSASTHVDSTWDADGETRDDSCVAVAVLTTVNIGVQRCQASVELWLRHCLNRWWYHLGLLWECEREEETEEKVVQEMASWQEKVCSCKFINGTRKQWTMWFPELPVYGQRIVPKSTAYSKTKNRKKNTVMREAVSAEERLSVTLR